MRSSVVAAAHQHRANFSAALQRCQQHSSPHLLLHQLVRSHTDSRTHITQQRLHSSRHLLHALPPGGGASVPPAERIANVRAASSFSSSTSSSNSSDSSSTTSSSSTRSSSYTGQQRPAAFTRHGITGDGSCMFRAVVQGHHHAQHGRCMASAQEEYQAALQLRRDVVQALRDARDEMEPFLSGIADDFEGYLQVMSQPGVWGGEPELLMASRVLKRPICVWQPSAWAGPQHIVTYGEDLLKEAAPMHVLWSGAHYDLLLPAQPAASKL